MLTASSLSIGYDKNKPLISAINFSCAPSELIVLLGINGIGKSTLLRTLCGLLHPLSGTVSYDDRNIFKMEPAERAKVVSAVFTGRDFDPFITIREFVALGRYPYTNWLGNMKEADTSIVAAALEAMGLRHLADKKIQQVSDGERQKALIAKSLAQDTPVIILDEPTAFLDYKNKAELLEIIKGLIVQKQKMVLLSTHDMSAALPYSDRAFMITESGKFITERNNSYTEKELKEAMEHG